MDWSKIDVAVMMPRDGYPSVWTLLRLWLFPRKGRHSK